jgi:hypothetical protein
LTCRAAVAFYIQFTSSPTPKPIDVSTHRPCRWLLAKNSVLIRGEQRRLAKNSVLIRAFVAKKVCKPNDEESFNY